jgi:hypothetical protein
MKKISDKISLIPLSNINAQYKQSISIKDESSNFTYTSCSSVQFSQDPDDTEAGLKYNITHVSVCNRQEIMAYNNKKVVARMYMMNRDTCYMGTTDVPAKVIVTPAQGTLYKVEIKVSLPYPLDL